MKKDDWVRGGRFGASHGSEYVQRMGAMRYGHAKGGFLFRRWGWILVVVCKAAGTAMTDDGCAIRQQAGKRSLGRDAVGLYAASANDGVSLLGCERFGWRVDVTVIGVCYAD